MCQNLYPHYSGACRRNRQTRRRSCINRLKPWRAPETPQRRREKRLLALTKSIRYPLVRAVPEALPAASPGLLLEGASPGRLLTLDLNHGLLAGTFLPADNQQIAFWSSGLSGADGVFEDPPGPGRTFWRCAARHPRSRRSPRRTSPPAGRRMPGHGPRPWSLWTAPGPRTTSPARRWR